MRTHWRDDAIHILLSATFLCFAFGKYIPESCQVITVKFCRNMPYNYTKLPNSLNHDNQDNIDKILSHFDPLVQMGCSKFLEKFLCSLYVPFCTEVDPILPCKDLCVESRTKCEVHMKQYGYSWPKIMDCEQYPEKDLCIPLETDYNDTGFDSTELLYSYTDVDSKEVNIDASFREHIILLIATYTQILLYDVRAQDLIPIYKGLDEDPGAAIDFHYDYKFVFWTEKSDGQIFRANMTSEYVHGVKEIIDCGPSTIEGIAIDWITNHVFWLEAYPSRLKVAKLDGSDPTIIHEFPDENKNPKGLVIDPLAGYLFWIDSVGDLYAPGACIERYDIRSNKIFTVYNITDDELHNMGRPRGLVLDMKSRLVYWTDARSESIQRIGYDGSKFKMVKTSHEFLSEPLALAKYKKHLFWSDSITKSIGRIEVGKSKRDPSFIETLIGSPATDIKVFHRDMQPKGESLYTITLKKTVKVNRSAMVLGNYFLIVSLCLVVLMKQLS